MAARCTRTGGHRRAPAGGQHPALASCIRAGDNGQGPQSPGSSLLIDVLYHPWPSPLARLWASSGGAVIGGVEMLVMQGVSQVELMTGLAVPPEVLRDAAMGELDRRNIAQAEQ